MKLLIVAGGGGHFSPALAVIEQLPKSIDVMVIGRKYAFEGDKTLSFEQQTSEKLGIRFASITTGRLQRKLTRHTLSSLVKVPIGFFQARKILKTFKPDVVLSFGGYVSIPVALAARTLSIPIIVHEQTLGAGLANKFVAHFAEKIGISWKESERFFPPGKTVLTGNPIRKFVKSQFPFQLPNEKLPIIYVTGGSAGAHAINILIDGYLEKLLQRYILIHQTGDAQVFSDFTTLSKKRTSLPPALQKRYILTKFVEAQTVFDVFLKADLVVSRAGINTITELLSLGKPCVLIPLPYGQRNEQATNASFAKEKGIAEVVEQKTLTPESLYAVITHMIDNLAEYKKHSETARQTIVADAAHNLLNVIYDYQQKEIKKS